MKKIEAIKELIKHLDKYPTSEKEEKNLEYRSKMIEGKINKLKKSDVLIERYFYQGWGVDEGKYFMKVEVPRQTRPRDVWIIRGPWDNGTEEIKIPMKTFLRNLRVSTATKRRRCPAHRQPSAMSWTVTERLVWVMFLPLPSSWRKTAMK